MKTAIKAACVAGLIVSATTATSGCASYPTSTTTQGGVSSGLSFSSLPPTAMVSLDGSVVGSAGDFSGAKILAASPGTHRVTVTHEGRIIVDRDYYVGREGTVTIQAQ